MKYTFDGNLRGVVCPGIDEPVADATVRLYRGDGGPELAARVAARPKQTSAIIDEKRVEAKAGRLLAEADTDGEGNFSVVVDGERADYDGEAVELDVRLSGVPGEHEPDAGPVQVTVTTLQPEWRKADDGARFGLEHRLSRGLWCAIRAQFGGRVICGQLTFCTDEEPVNGVTVRAYDADIIEDDPLGSAVTAGGGYFLIHYRREDYVRTPLTPYLNVEIEHGPDLFFSVEASDGTVLLAEPREKGREPGREDAEVCAHITDLCLPADRPGPEEELTTALWTGIGSAFDVPADVTDDGYLSAGTTEFALTGRASLTGSTPLRNAAGNPVEYRFLVSDTVASNADPALPASVFAATAAPGDRTGPIGVGDNADAFASATVGKAIVFDTATSSLEPVTVVARGSDLDGEGWLSVDTVLDRALTDAGYTRGDLRYWDDVDTLVRLDTRALAPADASPPVPAAGRSVDTATEGFPTREFALRFEARDAVTGDPTPGSGRTLNRLVMDNNPTVTALELKKSVPGDPCDPVTGQVALAYTAYHPHLGRVRLHRQRNEGSPGGLVDSAGDSSKAPFDGDVAGGPVQVFSYDGTGDPDAVSNQFDITPADTCTYVVWMSSRRRLHTGDSQVPGDRTRLIPFYYEA
jgi:hypothetical protein